MTDSISIAVVVPCYNIADVIEPTLRSIQTQTRQPDEIIIVDDGSEDGTPEAVKRILPTATVLRCEHCGPSAARNAGWRAASTTHIAFLDGDDLWTPSHLANAEACLLRHPNLRWYSCAWRMEDHLRNIHREIRSTGPFECEGDCLNYFLARPHGHLPIVCTGTVVAGIGLLRQTGGFDEELKRGDDTEMWVRFASAAPHVGYSTDVGFQYIKRASSLSETPHKSNESLLVLRRKIRDNLLRCKGLTPRQRRQWFSPVARVCILILITSGAKKDVATFALDQRALLSLPQKIVLAMFQRWPAPVSAWYRRRSVLRTLLRI